MLKVPNMRWYEGYEPKPKVLLSTLGDTRSGMAFQEIESPRFGSFDSAASMFSLGWTLDPLTCGQMAAGHSAPSIDSHG